jgi:hypothetical protein
LDAGKIRVNFHVLGGFRIDIFVSVRVFMIKMKRVTTVEEFLELVSNFIEASKKFEIKYQNWKLFQNFKKTFSAP